MIIKWIMITIIELKISLRENHMKYPLFCSDGQVEFRSNVRLTSGQRKFCNGCVQSWDDNICRWNQHYTSWPVRLHTTSFFHLASIFLLWLLLLLLLLLVVVVVFFVICFVFPLLFGQLASVSIVCFWYVFNTVSAWFACMSVISKWRFGEAFIHVR